MTVYVFAGTSDINFKKARKIGVEKSLAVFGWGYDPKFDLNGDEKTSNPAYGKIAFLKGIQAGDKIIYVHYNNDNKSIEESHYGDCTIMNVVGGYEFNNSILEECKDFGHTIKIDQSSVYTFNRNSPSIHPLVSKALKPRASYQRLYCTDKLESSIKNHKEGIVENYFETEINEGLQAIINTIQTNHPDKALESFIKPLLEKIYSNKYTSDNVFVKVNGSGWGSDNGADLIITYKENFEDLDLEVDSNKEHKVVVQAKSYKWFINDNNAIEQCKNAMETYNAEYAILITTAKISPEFSKKIEEYNSNLVTQKDNKLGMISFIDGETLAKLYIKYMK